MAEERAAVVDRALVAHRMRHDWTCACGIDFFGGTASYSLSEHRAHVTAAILAALDSRDLQPPCGWCHQPWHGKPSFDCKNPMHTGAPA